MHTENKKNCWRFFIGILFWTIICCLGLLLVPHGGTSQSGRETGSFTHGSDTEQGDGTFSTDEQSTDTENSTDVQTEGPETTAPLATHNTVPPPTLQNTAEAPPEQTVSPKPNQSRTENPKASLKILSTESASEDTATIFRAGEKTGSGNPPGSDAEMPEIVRTGKSTGTGKPPGSDAEMPKIVRTGKSTGSGNPTGSDMGMPKIVRNGKSTGRGKPPRSDMERPEIVRTGKSNGRGKPPRSGMELPEIVRTGKGNQPEKKSEFFGVKVTGSSIFLLDISGSMDGRTKGGTRLDLVKTEMKKTLEAMYSDAQKRESADSFKIVCFSDRCIFFPKKKRVYNLSSRDHVMEAIDFVNKLAPGGNTNMKNAWTRILPIIREQEIKSVYFLSDGNPTDCNPGDLLSLLKAHVPELEIHTFSMGQQSLLLESIANQHHGQYREIGIPSAGQNSFIPQQNPRQRALRRQRQRRVR